MEDQISEEKLQGGSQVLTNCEKIPQKLYNRGTIFLRRDLTKRIFTEEGKSEGRRGTVPKKFGTTPKTYLAHKDHSKFNNA